jgi:4-carboxymuconolactone decarboxylase
MRNDLVSDSFEEYLRRFDPSRNQITRALSLYSASVAVADQTCLRAAQRICRNHGASSKQLYEVMLQSYLFLGFPRMLVAAEQLAEAGLAPRPENRRISIGGDDVAVWLERGEALCRRVYESNYEALKERVEKMAPEVFLWMELEGYGKVLSRPGLDIVNREMAIVACLIVDDRPAQLHSHMRGAMNVGAPKELLLDVVSDLAPVAGRGCATACEVIKKLELE